MTRPLTDIDLSDPDYFAWEDPHEVWTRMRRETPVAWTNREGLPGFWSLTRHADISTVSKDRANFTVTKGSSLGSDRSLVRGTSEEESPVETSGRNLLTTDPPEHTRLRRLVSSWFTPGASRQLEPRIREIARGFLDALDGAEECDFVRDIAAVVPIAVICEMMGIPKSDWDFLIALGNEAIGGDDPDFQEGSARDTAASVARKSAEYFTSLVEERRKNPGDDIVSNLLGAEFDGESLSPEDLISFCLLLVVAGNETTRNTLSSAVMALSEYPAQRRLLAENREILPTAVDEILRWVTPIKHFYRTAVNEVEVGGQQIAPGERVVMWYPSANRDEDVFAEPFVFDLTRTPNNHLAFGIGVHVCLGSHLARVELEVMLDELMNRYPAVEPIGPPQARLRSTFMGGIKSLPVRLGG